MKLSECAVRTLSAFAIAFLAATPCYGEVRLDKVIVDFSDAKLRRSDIEVTNQGKAPVYVSVMPAEIVRPGRTDQKRRTHRDPMEMGMLVSPTRMILEPGQTKPVRLAVLERPKERDRIYRVKIAPAAGRTVAIKSGLRILVGYDVLVIVRPENAKAGVVGERKGRRLTLRNTGNTNALLISGKQCDKAGKCVELPTTRLYAGTTWSVDLPKDAPAEYTMHSGGVAYSQKF